MDFRQSQTFRNIEAAYQVELEANGKYSLFAKRAGQEELIEISLLFDTVSRNELFISERLRSIIHAGQPDTLQNLIEARDSVLMESNLYREFARTAIDEGYTEYASLFSGIANIMLSHHNSFENIIKDAERNELFCKPQEGLWLCLGCGNILSGLCAPDRCPICGYPQSYYELLQFI
ncbi:MAG: rubrerythrin family protein [Anaerolineaceae bacterium]|nr:MAG: rubrerythrin family protein [Anaerolineaceae bacterium]